MSKLNLILSNKYNHNLKNELKKASKILQHSENIFWTDVQESIYATNYVYNMLNEYSNDFVGLKEICSEIAINLDAKYKFSFIKNIILKFINEKLILLIKTRSTIEIFPNFRINVIKSNGLLRIFKVDKFSLNKVVKLKEYIETNYNEVEAYILLNVFSIVERSIINNNNLLMFIGGLCIFKIQEKSYFIISPNLLELINSDSKEAKSLEINSINYSNIIKDIISTPIKD